MSLWTKGLNPEQAEAVLHSKGPLLILAGAGSGKTTVLVARTGRILAEEGVPPGRVCVLTFTNKAARELKHRVTTRLGSSAQAIWTGTFHSFGLQWMRKHHKKMGLPSGFGVIDSSDAEGIVRELLKDMKNQSKDAFRIGDLLEMMNSWREDAAILGKAPEHMGKNDGDEYEVMASALLPKYRRKLELLGVTDFSDLLIRPLLGVREDDKLKADLASMFDFLMVDEFQDTNGAQLELVREIQAKTGNIAVVGDDDQSIYGWRGARVANILDFPKEFKGARVVRLERNYRSSPAILELANSIIENNKERHGKTLRSNPEADLGERPEFFSYESEEIEVAQTVARVREFTDQGITPREIAILYRSNGQGGLLEAELRREQVPYAITGGTAFFDRKEVKDVLAYLRSSISPNEVAFRRIVATPPRGIGDTSIDKLAAWAELKGVRFHVAARKWEQAGLPDRTGEAFDGLFLLLDKLPLYLMTPDPSIEGDSPGRRLIRILDEIKYREHIRSMHKETEAFEKRWLGIEVLARVLDSYLSRVEGKPEIKDLARFIDAMELRDSDQEEQADADKKIQLLTLHACKGLEFDAVCLIGCEEDLLPHRTLGEDVSEERRLFYVGVTRARKHLILSRAKIRRRFGRLAPVAISRFIQEVPEHLLRRYEEGARPLAKAERANRLGDMFAKLDARVAAIAAEQDAEQASEAESLQEQLKAKPQRAADYPSQKSTSANPGSTPQDAAPNGKLPPRAPMGSLFGKPRK
jgi:superfamily I DNA/RNA helicase